VVFCRICGTRLEDNARFCDRCGTSIGQMPVRIEHASSLNSLPDHKVDKTSTQSKTSTIFAKLLPWAFMTFAVCLLGQYTLENDVQTFFLDDKYYEMILTALRVRPFEYYSIAVALYHQLYAPTLAIIHFPLIFYIWLIVPTDSNVKWLYFAFALAGTVAAYWTVAVITKRRSLAILTGAWIAYFLQTGAYFMFEYWAITVFLVGLSYFVSERHVPAAVAIGLATLIKEVFAPFMVIASIYYALPIIQRFCLKQLKIGEFFNKGKASARPQTIRQAIVWCLATSIVGLAYYQNGIASQGTTSPVQFFRTFDLSLLPMLFSNSWFTYPPIPVTLTVCLGLIGISTLARWDQRIIVYASFASIILLMLTAGDQGLISTWEEIQQSAPRYVAMSITLINLFWLIGIYKIIIYIGRKINISLDFLP